MKRRWLRRSLVAVLVLVGVLLIGVLGAWLYLTSDAGSERVRAAVSSGAAAALAGRLEVKTLSLEGGHIVLEGLKLYTPEGELVAELERAELELKLGALLSKDVVIRDARLSGVRLYLASDERGLNLSRAVAAKHPSTAPSSGPRAAVHVEVQQLSLQRGYVSWQQEYVLDDIGIDGHATVKTGEQLKLGGKLTAHATLEGEQPLPFQLGVEGDQAKLGVTAKLGGAHLDGDFSLDAVSARIAELFVPPQVAQRFAEEFPLQVPLTARGEASPHGLDLKLEAGKARATAQAKLEGATVPSFAVHAEAVDLAELLGKGRPSQLQVDAKGRMSNGALDSLDGALDLQASWTKVGKLKVKADAKAGAIDVEQLALDVRGASLDARGKGDAKAMQVQGELDASDLAALAKAIAEVTGGEPLPLSGAGTVKVRSSGPLRHPRIEAKGDLQVLRVNDIALNGLKFDAGLADASRPFEARLEAFVARISAGERNFDQVHASLDTRGRELDLALSSKGFASLSLTANGTVDADGKGIALAALGLHYPEADWKLESPTHVSVANGLVVEPLTLLSLDQRIALQAKLQGGRIDARVDVKNLELTHLPHAFVPTKWGLGGKLDAHASASGRSAAPDADASITWRNGSVRTLRGLQLSAQARYSKDRAAGAIDGTSGIGALKASFDLPVKGLQKKSDEPLTAQAELSGVTLEALGPLLEVDLPLTGVALLKVTAEGTGAKPRVTAHAEAKDATWQLDAQRTVPVEQLALDVTPAEDGTLKAEAVALAFGATADVRLNTPLTVEGLRSKPPDAAALRALPVELFAKVEHLELATLSEANLLKGYEGGVTVRLEAKGSVDHPDAKGELGLDQVHGERLKPIDASLAFESSRNDTKLTLAAKAGASRLVQLTANAEAPLETLVQPDRAVSVGFRGDGDIGPFGLDDVLLPGDETQPRGTIKAKVELLGSVVDPKARVRGQLEQVGLGKVPLGKANFSYDYQHALSTFGATLFTGEQGQLRMRGTVKLDLSQPGIKKGLHWREAPLDVDVSSAGLDLAFLSGVIETVPRLEGQLDAKAAVSGTLGLPGFKGSAQWTKGRIAVQSYGEYRDIDVRLEGTDRTLKVEKLFAKAGSGWASLYGTAQRYGEQWHAQLGGESKDFPLITDDQLKASLTLELKAEALVTPTLIDVRRLAVPRAVIELPDVKGKDLQDLERPENIVLVRKGVPVNRRQRKKLDALEKKVSVEAPPPAREIRVVVEADKNIWLKSSDVNAEAGLSPGFAVNVNRAVTLSGEVQVKRGRLDVIGRRFDLDPSSSVKFSGAANRAYVNVRATYKNEREGVSVLATVVGQMPQFSIRLDSTPPMSESDIFALIATGRRTLKQGGSASITNDQVASVLGSFAASQLKSVLGKKLPLDVLSIESGSDGLKGTRVEGGKYLTDQVYLGLEARYGADPKKGENDVAAKIEYEFVPHWSVEAYGGNAAYGADLIWSRQY